MKKPRQCELAGLFLGLCLNQRRRPVGAALAAKTGGAGAIHRVGFFAGQARSHRYPLMQYLGEQLACSISRS
ncbi:hypothetical protein E8E68_11915 [Pseudomonas sp. BN607]|nr:hypothetical protein [Pseudomonas sp. BN607]